MFDPALGAYAPAVAAFIERLRRQEPLAIVHFGSSLRPEDFIPGVSDFDLLVVSEEPLADVENDVNYTYFFVPPQQFVSQLAAGDLVYRSALRSGRVLHDPRGFIRKLRELVDAGLPVAATLTTLRNSTEIVTRGLSLAMTLYFSGKRDEATVRALLHAVYSTAKGLGAYHALAATGEVPDGFSEILRAVQAYPEIAEVLRRARQRLLEGVPAARPAPGPLVRIEDDALGSAILEVERVYCDSVSLLPGRRMTNSLIDAYSASIPLTRTLAVHIDTRRNHHLIVARSDERHRQFGLRRLNAARPLQFGSEVSDLASLEALIGQPLERVAP